MNKKLYSLIKYGILLGVGAGLLYLAFKKVNINETIDKIKNANLLWVTLSVIASLIAFFSRAIRWNLLIHPLGYKPKVMNTSTALMIGYLANLAIPRLGEVTRCGTLTQSEKIPFEKLIGTVITERIIDVLSLLACMILVAFFEFERLTRFLNENFIDTFKHKINSIINSPFLILLTLAIFFLLVYIVFASKKGKAFLNKAKVIFKGIGDGIISVRKMKKPLLFLFHTILIWTMYFLMSYFCFFALESTAGLNWHAGLFILVVGGLGMSAPVPGGLGAYHWAVSLGLMLFGISYDDGITFATLMHTTNTLVVIVLGSLSFLHLFLKQRNGTANAS